MIHKPIHINTFRGFGIKYKDGLFYVEKNKQRIYSGSTEQSIKDMITNDINKNEKERITKQLQKTKIKFKDVKDVREFFRCIELYNNEAIIRLNNRTMQCLTMDPANVAFIKRNLKFIGNADEINFMVKTKLFITGLANITGEAVIFFPTIDKLAIETKNGTVTFPIDLDIGNLQKEVNLEPKITFKMDKDILYGYFSLANNVAESIRFIGDGKTIHLEAEGDINTYKSNSIGKTNQTCQSKFSLSYLISGGDKRFFRTAKTITIGFGQDYPIKLEDENNNILILAPRVGD